MSDVDWSKAPEWATKLLRNIKDTSGRTPNCWVGDDWRGKWVTDTSEYKFWVDKTCWDVVAVRPAAWNGEGLPPVGIEIEALMPGLGSSRFWQLAKVVHGPIEGAPGEVLVYSLETTRPAWVDELRPIRPPEQIAAEERKKSIEEMIRSIHPGSRQVAIVNSAYGYLEDACADLYDAGYRRQEPKP